MIVRFDPFRELNLLAGDGRRAGTIPVDAYRKGDQVHLEFDLPGVDPSEIEVTDEKDLIRIRAERCWDDQNVEALVCERPQGTFVCELHVGDDLEVEKLSAVYRNGVLRLTLPVVEPAKTRRIAVAAALPVAGAIIEKAAPAPAAA